MTMADIQTLTKEKVKLDEPGLYDVIFLNDNITKSKTFTNLTDSIRFVDTLLGDCINTFPLKNFKCPGFTDVTTRNFDGIE